MPFSVRGTGISFEPATAFAHSSNEPVLPLGTGITLDKPLANDHEINAVVRDADGHDRGLPGDADAQPVVRGPRPRPPAPATWCCVTPPAWSSTASTTAASSTHGPPRVTRPTSGAGESGCRVPAPGAGRGGFGGPAGPAASTPNRSAGRFPDGADTDSNCRDFLLQTATTLSAASAAGANNIKVASVADFGAGQTIMIDTGANRETAVIATVGTPGATTVGTATDAGATVIPVASAAGFSAGQTITIDSGANRETAVVASVTGGRGRLWRLWRQRRPWRRHDHRRRAAHDRARGRRTGLRHRHHPHRRIDQGACQRGAGRRQRSHARCAQPVSQETSVRTLVELN